MSRSLIGKQVKLTNPKTIHLKCTDGVSTIGFKLNEGSLGKVIRHYARDGEIASPITIVRLHQHALALTIDVICAPYEIEVVE